MNYKPSKTPKSITSYFSFNSSKYLSFKLCYWKVFPGEKFIKWLVRPIYEIPLNTPLLSDIIQMLSDKYKCPYINGIKNNTLVTKEQCIIIEDYYKALKNNNLMECENYELSRKISKSKKRR